MKWSGPAVKRGETIGASGDAQRNSTVQQQDASHIKSKGCRATRAALLPRNRVHHKADIVSRSASA
ncbi:hypothetical protein M2202_008845 [Bradyrhizobium japonicum]|nr:hypothetical protein [Bradyrhizobium japonicum]